MSTAEIRTGGGEDAAAVVVGRRKGKEREKKEREPPGKVEMRWRRRGVAVEGQVEWQMVVQMWSCWEEEWTWEEAQLAEARVGPSRRLRM